MDSPLHKAAAKEPMVLSDGRMSYQRREDFSGLPRGNLRIFDSRGRSRVVQAPPPRVSTAPGAVSPDTYGVNAGSNFLRKLGPGRKQGGSE